jgi:hypothetical protein
MATKMRRTYQRGQRRHGLNRCRYKNAVGMQSWVGLGVISDNLFNIGRAMSQRVSLPPPSAFDYRPLIPAGFDLLCAMDQRLETINFCAGKLLGRGTTTNGRLATRNHCPHPRRPLSWRPRPSSGSLSLQREGDGFDGHNT